MVIKVRIIEAKSKFTKNLLILEKIGKILDTIPTNTGGSVRIGTNLDQSVALTFKIKGKDVDLLNLDADDFAKFKKRFSSADFKQSVDAKIGFITKLVEKEKEISAAIKNINELLADFPSEWTGDNAKFFELQQSLSTLRIRKSRLNEIGEAFSNKEGFNVKLPTDGNARERTLVKQFQNYTKAQKANSKQFDMFQDNIFRIKNTATKEAREAIKKEILARRNPDDTIDLLKTQVDLNTLKNVIDDIDDDVTRAFQRQETGTAIQATKLGNEEMNKTQAFGSVDFDEATKEWNATPGFMANPKPKTEEIEELLNREIFKLPEPAGLDALRKRKLTRYLVAAGLLAGAGTAAFVAIRKFLDDEVVTPAQAEPGQAEPAQGQEGGDTTPAADPQTQPAPQPGQTGQSPQVTQTTAPAQPGQTGQSPQSPTSTTVKPPTSAASSAAATKAGGGACKDENQFKKLSAREKINCGVKNQRYIDFAKAYREARSLVGNIVKSTVLDSDMLTDFRAATQNKINPDSIIKHILNQILPMRGILIRYGIKQVKKRDAKEMAAQMDKIMLIAQDPSEQIIPFTLPPEIEKTFVTKDDINPRIGKVGSAKLILQYLQQVDRKINRKAIIRAIERALDEHLKPWTPISRGPVDFDQAAARKYAATSKLEEQNEKTYDLEFSKWKKMFL